MKKNYFIVVCFATFLAFTSCNNALQGPEKIKESVTTPVSYGNGVYYFGCVERDFAVSLSTFIENTTKDSLEIKAITSDGSNLYGVDKGYFVVVAKK